MQCQGSAPMLWLQPWGSGGSGGDGAQSCPAAGTSPTRLLCARQELCPEGEMWKEFKYLFKFDVPITLPSLGSVQAKPLCLPGSAGVPHICICIGAGTHPWCFKCFQNKDLCIHALLYLPEVCASHVLILR